VVSLALFSAVSALLVTWSVLRWRRLEATTDGGAFLSTASGVASEPFSWPRPTLAQLGLNALGRRLLALDVAVLVIDVFLFARAGLTLDWSTVWFGELILSALIIAWLNFYFVPGAPREWFVAEVVRHGGGEIALYRSAAFGWGRAARRARGGPRRMDSSASSYITDRLPGL
jgi:hypothetical protein